jgi:hypothetical protein
VDHQVQLRMPATQHATFTLPRRTLLRLRREVPAGERSAFVSLAVEEQLNAAALLVVSGKTKGLLTNERVLARLSEVNAWSRQRGLGGGARERGQYQATLVLGLGTAHL